MIAIFQGVPLLITSDVFARTPWWAYLGGLLGMLGLTANILLFLILGSVQTVILPILGQLLMSILIDHFGLFHTLLRPLSFIRFLGLISLIVGVLLIVFLPSYLKQKR
ncbi:DMT family transporter [Enterococcus cecorum]|nr:DMT family transporter [Enterococcus cecorum]